MSLDPVAPEPSFIATDAARAVEPVWRYAATILLCSTWVVVYLVMAWRQGTLHADPASWLAGGIRPQTAYIFGALTSSDVQGGEYWRVLTATMLHFSLVHLAINTWVMFQLGRMIEPWYGSAQFLVVYVVIGAGANLLAAALRPWTGQSPLLQSGGGSGVICGLIALVGVVGWRSRSRFGAYMLRQMAIQLVLIGLMGWLIPNIDNLVHAAGAVMGTLVGFMDRWLMARAGRPSSRFLGIVALALLVGSGAAQDATQRALESRQRELFTEAARLDAQRRALGLASASFRFLASAEHGEDRRSVAARDAAQSTLQATIEQLAPDVAQADSSKLSPILRIGRVALERRPDPGQVRQFLTAETNATRALLETQRDRVLQLREIEGRRGPLKIRVQASQPVNRPGRTPAPPQPGGVAGKPAAAAP